MKQVKLTQADKCLQRNQFFKIPMKQNNKFDIIIIAKEEDIRIEWKPTSSILFSTQSWEKDKVSM